MAGRSLIPGVFDPSLQVEQLDLNNFVESAPDLSREEADTKVERLVRTSTGPSSPDIPKPLTMEEAEAVDRKVAILRERIAATRGKLASLRGRIDTTASPEGSQEMAFQIDISKKPTLKRAIQRVFGVKTNTITYSMYKAALETLRQLEKQEAGDYLEGKDE